VEVRRLILRLFNKAISCVDFI